MFKKLKVLFTKSKVNTKVNNSINYDRKDLYKTFWLKEEFIDEKLLKEDIEVIKLYYDKYSKWITLHNASVLWFFAILLWYWWVSIILNFLLIFLLLSSIIKATKSNVVLNKVFNTLLKKTREISNN